MQLIDINGVEFIVGQLHELRDRFQHRPDMPLRPLQNGLCYIPVSGYISNGEIYQAAGIDMNKIDFATPQDWFNEWNEMIKSRGGAVWSYEGENMMGHPIFRDEAWCRIEALITLRVRPDSFIEPVFGRDPDNASDVTDILDEAGDE